MVTSKRANLNQLLMLAVLLTLLNACSQRDDQLDKEKRATSSEPTNLAQPTETNPELRAEQGAAFDALNKLQVNTDEKNRLYSTFAGIHQPCYPPDTSMTISQSEFLTAMKQFVAANCKNLSKEERDELAAASVRAQKKYTVLLCLDNSSPETFEQGAPLTGTWVLPNVLGKRDVIIEW